MGEGEGGMIWENGIETCMISCVRRVAGLGSMHGAGCLGLVHWDDPWDGVGVGGGFRVGSACVPVADSFWCVAKPIQCCGVKKLKKKKLCGCWEYIYLLTIAPQKSGKKK